MAWIENWLKNYKMCGKINSQVFINIKDNSAECPEIDVEVAGVGFSS